MIQMRLSRPRNQQSVIGEDKFILGKIKFRHVEKHIFTVHVRMLSANLNLFGKF